MKSLKSYMRHGPECEGRDVCVCGLDTMMSGGREGVESATKCFAWHEADCGFWTGSPCSCGLEVALRLKVASFRPPRRNYLY